MATFTRFILRHKRLVALAWLIVAAVAMASTGSAAGALSQRFSLPGRPGYEANQAILSTYATGGQIPPIVPVVTLPAGRTIDDPQVHGDLVGFFQRLQTAVPYARIVSPTNGDPALRSADGHTVFGLVYPRGAYFPLAQADQKAIDAAAAGAQVAGAPVRLTGLLELESNAGGNTASVLAETVVAGIGALVVLIFMFASFLALLPLLVAVVSIVTSFLLIWVLTSFMEVSFIVEFLVSLIGLGVAIDYSLLLVTRWREERDRGLSSHDAVVRAMETAGRAIIFSGTTVGIGLLSLLVLPVPFLRSVGVGGLLIPLVSVVVSITLLPVILATAGPRLDWPRIRHEVHASRAWTAWARLVVRRRWVAAGAAVVVLGALMVPLFSLTLGNPKADSLASSGDAHDGLVALESSGIGTGVLSPIEILTAPDQVGTVRDHATQVGGVRGVVAPSSPTWRRQGTAVVDVLVTGEEHSSEGHAAVTGVRDSLSGFAGVQVGGEAIQSYDFVDAVYGSFPLMLALVVVVTFLLLARAFRSILLPLKAVILNLVSLGAAYGILVLVWQQGYGSQPIWGIQSTGAITEWIPLMVFAFLFGLSMDYEVFILARMREERDSTGATATAVIRGLGRTGRLVTGAAVILFLAFVVLSSAPDTSVKILATGLAAGILLDATVIRALLVPALVSLFGRWNWWLPERPARLLRVAPAPLVPETVPIDD